MFLGIIFMLLSKTLPCFNLKTQLESIAVFW
jgi:hypothetical protein